MAHELTCDIRPSLEAASAQEWSRLFPDLPDAVEMIRFIQRSGVEGVTFHSVVVRHGKRPILLLPLFETVYDLSAPMDQRARPVMAAVPRWLPRLFRPRVLGVGFIESGWGQVGVEPLLEPARLDAAWDVALGTLHALADGLGAQIIAFVNFTTQSGRMIPIHKLQGFTEIASPPFGQLPIVYESVEEYLESLSGNIRSSVRRKIRRAHDIEVLRTRDPGPWLDTIYRRYRQTVKRSEVVGIHPRNYFERVCEAVPGAEYWLYFLKEQLLAFQLVIVQPDRFVDKYFGMDPLQGREQDLSLISWLESIRYCIERKIPCYYAGQVEREELDGSLTNFLPSVSLFQHRNPILHRFLTVLGRRLAYRPDMPLPRAQLGADWTTDPSRGASQPQPTLNGRGVLTS